MKNTVEMIAPETGETFVAIVDDEKLVPYAKITGKQIQAILRDRDELLAALKEIMEKFHVIAPRDRINAARALIARIEAGNG